MKDRMFPIERVVSHEVRGGCASFVCRAGTLAAVTMEVRVYSERCFRVRIACGPRPGERDSAIVVRSPRERLDVRESEGAVTIDAGEATLTVSLDPWHLSLHDRAGNPVAESIEEDRMLTGDRYAPPSGFTGEADEAGRPWVVRWEPRHVHVSLLLGAQEHLWGCGERFTRLEKSGQRIEIWNSNARGARSGLSYRNVPFYLSSAGYGLYADNTERVTFDFGASSTRSLVVDAESDELDLYLMVGSTPAEILREYAELTGKPRVPPKWALGLWISTCFDRLDRAKVEEEAAKIRELAIPCDVYHFDCFWLRDEHWSDLTWDEERFPNPEEMIATLKERGFKISVWENTYVSIFSEVYREGSERGYFLKNRDGEDYVTNLWLDRQPAMAIIDVTNPDAVAWYKERHRRLLRMGVDTFKTDFGEEIPPDAVYAGGQDGKAMHNLYSMLYQGAVFEVVEEKHGKGVIWARSGCAGSKRYPIHWSGDPECTFEDMAAVLRAGLSDSLMGHALWSHDIGGFYGTPSRELYVRWAQFGLLSPAARCHSQTPRFPWSFDAEVLAIFRSYAQLRYRLLPYLYSYAFEAAESGLPIARPMILEFPDDPTCVHLDLQYMLGRELLVAPIFSARGLAELYLPRGGWIHLLTGEQIEGPAWVRREVPLGEMPLYLRGDSLVPTVEPSAYVGERGAESCHLHLWDTSAGRFRLRDEGEETTLEAATANGVTTFRAVPSAGAGKGAVRAAGWHLHLHEVGRPKRVVAGRLAIPEVDSAAAPSVEAGWWLAEPSEAKSGWWIDRDSLVVKLAGDDCSIEW